MNRQPVVAGRFYDANPGRLEGMVDTFLDLAEEKRSVPTKLAMVPHAGYVFSGGVCGKTLGLANLESTVILLGPNHTGRGEKFSLWTEGGWDIPGATVPVDQELADVILECDPLIAADRAAHEGEHSLEVIVPFLRRLNPQTTIVPMAIANFVYDDLAAVGKAIGQALNEFARPVSILVSSDMSHYVSDEEAKKMDSMALEAAIALDPRALFSVVRQHNISMCGVLPMTVGLVAALEMGATKGELVAYTNSGEVSGDFDQVVGYAGVIVE